MRRELYRRSFADFARYFWPRVSGLPMPENVATQALCAALQAVGDGRLWRLLVALPPGVGKSTMLAISAAWRLARRAGWRVIGAKAAAADAERDSLRVRRLVQHEDFRALFPEVQLREDENTRAAWATTQDGRYYALGTDGAITSKRVHELVVDDPMTAADIHSAAARERAWTWLIESAMSRLDGDRAPVVIVSQRLGTDDMIGRCVESGEPWPLLELAAEFDSSRRCELRTQSGELIWSDPRTEEGELLAPEMLPRSKLDSLRVNAAMFSVQYQQRPTSDENAVIRRRWWRFHHGSRVSPATPRPAGCDTGVPAVPTPEDFDNVVIACDLTFGSQKGDYVSIQAWGADGSQRFLLRRFHKRCGLRESVQAIEAMTEEFPFAKVLVEKAANGRGAIEELKALGVSGVLGVQPLGSKEHRLGLVSATIEAGDCYLPLGMPGLADFVEELSGATKHDDEQDACAYALHDLNTRRRRSMPMGSIRHFIGPIGEVSTSRPTYSPRDPVLAHFAILGGGLDDEDEIDVTNDPRRPR